MFQLGISAACAYVRKSLDELTSVEDIGMLASPDAIDLHKIVEASIIEAAVKVHERASGLLMEGVSGTNGTAFGVEKNSDGSLTITAMKEAVRVLSVKASDSGILVTDFIPEDSAEARKQQNEHVRGTYDDPRVILMKKWAGDNRPVFRYYSPKSDTIPDIEYEYVPYPVIEESIIEICPRLEFAVLNELTAMVLESINEFDKAALFRGRAEEYMKA